jgi:hypothetical protein
MARSCIVWSTYHQTRKWSKDRETVCAKKTPGFDKTCYMWTMDDDKNFAVKAKRGE